MLSFIFLISRDCFTWYPESMKRNTRQITCRTSRFLLEWQMAQDICWLLHLPLLTFRLPFAVSFPKMFSASQLYSPASSSFTLLNCSLEIFLLKSIADISYSIANHPHELITIPGPAMLPGKLPLLQEMVRLISPADQDSNETLPRNHSHRDFLIEHLPLNPLLLAWRHGLVWHLLPLLGGPHMERQEVLWGVEPKTPAPQHTDLHRRKATLQKNTRIWLQEGEQQHVLHLSKEVEQLSCCGVPPWPCTAVLHTQTPMLQLWDNVPMHSSLQTKALRFDLDNYLVAFSGQTGQALCLPQIHFLVHYRHIGLTSTWSSYWPEAPRKSRRWCKWWLLTCPNNPCPVLCGNGSCTGQSSVVVQWGTLSLHLAHVSFSRMSLWQQDKTLC